MYPDFIGIGAQKAGTTWLHRNLQDHPQIFMPRKEVHYFDKKIHDRSNGLQRLFGRRQSDQQWRGQLKHWLTMNAVKQRPGAETLLWGFKYFMRPYDDEWYGQVFEPKKGRVAGEITPAYSTLAAKTVAHVHELAPEAKIIFMIRNPIERAWSHTVMSFDKVQKGSVESASEEAMLAKISRPNAALLNDYQRTFGNWQRFYPEERFFVGFLEDVHFFPAELLSRLCEFLGVDPSYEPEMATKKIHSRSADTMPTPLAVRLARSYREELEGLAGRFGGYAAFWLYCAERLIEGPPAGEEERIPYPFWNSSLWEDWLNGPGGEGFEAGRLRSGPLSSIEAVK
jgi:hypothetical protein